MVQHAGEFTLKTTKTYKKSGSGNLRILGIFQDKGAQMIKGYKDFYYNVKDMNKAVQFYSIAFGMESTYSNEFWTTMTLGNLSLGSGAALNHL